MTKKQIQKFLAEIEIFKQLDETELENLASLCHCQVYKAGEYLFEENSDRKTIFMIFSGEIELLKKTHFGEEKKLAVFGSSDFLGEGALLDDVPGAGKLQFEFSRRIPPRDAAGMIEVQMRQDDDVYLRAT